MGSPFSVDLLQQGQPLPVLRHQQGAGARKLRRDESGQLPGPWGMGIPAQEAKVPNQSRAARGHPPSSAQARPMQPWSTDQINVSSQPWNKGAKPAGTG